MLSNCNITTDEVISFQTRLMFGGQYKRVLDANDSYLYNGKTAVALEDARNQIIIACLRTSWAPAFRHVSGNKSGLDEIIKKYEKENVYDDYICSLLKPGNINGICDVFREYLLATKNKHLVITNNFSTLEKLLKNAKINITFGHLQKLFGMATKFYLCLYNCRTWLKSKLSLYLNDDLFIGDFKNAECPIDSKILDILDRMNQESGTTKNWNKGIKWRENTKWSQLKNKKPDINMFKEIQENIAAYTQGRSNLSFDFDYWL